jgi:hypothetical protein
MEPSVAASSNSNSRPGLPTCYKARTNHYKSTPIKKLGGKKVREKKLRLFDQLSKIIGFETPLLYLSRLGLGLLLDGYA